MTSSGGGERWRPSRHKCDVGACLEALGGVGASDIRTSITKFGGTKCSFNSYPLIIVGGGGGGGSVGEGMGGAGAGGAAGYPAADLLEIAGGVACWVGGGGGTQTAGGATERQRNRDCMEGTTSVEVQKVMAAAPLVSASGGGGGGGGGILGVVVELSLAGGGGGSSYHINYLNLIGSGYHSTNTGDGFVTICFATAAAITGPTTVCPGENNMA